jgi:ParB family chromosome partitioning protein
VGIDRIDPNPYQTRRDFNEPALAELRDSIAAQGVLQPIVVRPAVAQRFILILGERRLRASKMAGKTTIPVIVRRVSEQQAAEMTLVENLQRQDLNCVEQAEAFANLSTEFKLTQEQIGARAGVSRESVSNYMRLLTLPEGVIGALQKGKLTYSHARTLLHLRDNVQIWKFAQKAMEEKMSVAKLEDLVLGMSAPSGRDEPNKGGGARWMDPNVKAAQRSLEEVLGMRVRIRDRKGKGRIVIEYGTLEDFDRVVGMLKGK